VAHTGIFTPIWQGFDYYFELDSIRVPHKTESLERYQRRVNLARPVEGESARVGPVQQYMRAPKWFQEMFPPDENYKGKFDDLFGHGPNPQSFNLRVRDVKRGKGGLYVQGGKVRELRASEKEIEEYEYPERPDWRAQAARKGQLFDNPVAHQGGGNTGLKKERWVRPSRANVPGRDELGNTIKKHGSSQDGRAGLGRPHFEYQEGIGSIQHREGMDGIVAPLDPKGRKPGDTITERQQSIIEHFKQKGSGGHYLYGGIESPEGRHEHPLGKNPGDFLSINTKPFPGAHFAVYPEALCEMPIKASSRPGDIVLDPFCGSGTTGVVAKKLGRKAILIDCVESYCAMSRDRIKKVEYQPELPLQQSTTRK